MIEINKDTFDKEVVESEQLVLADFNADWCGPCRMLRPILEELDNDKIKIVSINIDNNDELTEKYNVSSIPCLILFDKGVEIKRNIGFISKEEIIKMIGE